MTALATEEGLGPPDQKKKIGGEIAEEVAGEMAGAKIRMKYSKTGKV